MDWKGEIGKLCILIVIMGFFFWVQEKTFEPWGYT
jgi:hypothetical protein